MLLFSVGQLKDWRGNGEVREGITCSKGPQGGIKPGEAVARTQPLYMGHQLSQLS